MKKVQLELDEEEYKELLLCAHIGQFVSYGFHHPGKKKINEINDLFQKVLTAGFNQELSMIIKNKEYDEFEFSKEIEKQLLKRIGKYNDSMLEETMEEVLISAMQSSERPLKVVKKTDKKITKS
jgi:hypothetical protein